MVDLIRYNTGPQGTPGYMIAGSWICATLELPWKSNQPNISCIPEGIYHCTLVKSPKFGWCYWVKKVPGRTVIRIHRGCFAGDRKLGLISRTYGCILQGRYHGQIGRQEAVLVSRPTIKDFIEVMNGEDFELKIVNFF